MTARAFSEIRLINGSIGDPVLYIDYPGTDNALQFDAGELGSVDLKWLSDLEAVFLTHHHIDHFVGFDRIIRANIDQDKTLHIFGPEGTIRKIYDRIKSYEFQYFPFQKIIMHVHELIDGIIRSALLECTRRFPEPEVTEEAWSGRIIYENAHLSVEAVPAEHTVPCFSYALVEKSGYHPDPEKLAKGLLRPGPWVQEALQLLRGGKPRNTVLEIHGGKFPLGVLGDQYFAKSRGSKVAYITDTAWSDTTREPLTQLAKGAWRLYCDSYYSIAQLKQAGTHKHMTATHAAELAQAAKVEELVLMHFGPRYAGRYPMLLEEAAKVFPRVSAELSE